MTLVSESARTWVIVALANFLIAGALGLLLRIAFVTELPGVDYVRTMQAHSHLAMLGWVYQGLYALFVKVFLPPPVSQKPIFNNLFWATQAIVVLMTISMLIFGYTSITIGILALHILLSYFFAVKYLVAVRSLNSYSVVVSRWAVMFMILSTLALWSLGPIVAAGMKGSAFYYATIQFFLHFQLNGWFVFGALALFFKVLEMHDIPVRDTLKKPFLFLLVVSCLLTYVLAVTWSTPLPALFWVNSLGVSLQLGALILFLGMVLTAYRMARRALEPIVRALYGVGMIAFSLKILVQTAVVVPYIATVAYTIRNFVIAFIHLVVLGIATHMLLAVAGVNGSLDLGKSASKLGVLLIFLGFGFSEFVLAAQGSMFWAGAGFLPSYYEMLAVVSGMIPLGILLLLLGQVRSREEMI